MRRNDEGMSECGPAKYYAEGVCDAAEAAKEIEEDKMRHEKGTATVSLALGSACLALSALPFTDPLSSKIFLFFGGYNIGFGLASLLEWIHAKKLSKLWSKLITKLKTEAEEK